ncbi:MAG: CRTAC1 family protein [Planctomycetota bacterium]|nr:CRTAC1 family protein [Planctomycetota bacterium]
MICTNLLIVAALCSTGEARFVDVTDAVGLGADVIPAKVARVCLADLDGDGRPDAVIDRHRVFLNRPDPDSPIGRRFVEVAPEPPEGGALPVPVRGTLTVFADLDNDGRLDAIITEYIDANNDKWEDHGRRTRWRPGRGDGTFAEPLPFPSATPATTCAVAVGDVDRNGRLDLWLGNWYEQYGASYAGYRNELLMPLFTRHPGIRSSDWLCRRLPRVDEAPPADDVREEAADEEDAFDEERDAAGRPTYGAMIADLDGRARPELLELNYGRRWNRCWRWKQERRGDGPVVWWDNVAPEIGFDGDDVRHGRYPDWAVQRMAQRDPPIELEPEKPFRSNGNTFDCSVGDIDNDGDFDIFLAEITHGWAGESSDRSRFLVNRPGEGLSRQFDYDPRLSVDRIPEGVNNWNQGDLFCELADLNHDTRLDLVLSSGDYPDDQRLRIFLQQEDGTFNDETAALGLDHDGAQQVSLGDIDADGDLDILVGQTFFRYNAEQKAGRAPHPRLFINETSGGRKSITLRLKGDGEQVSSDALGAIVRAKLADGTMMSRQLIGIGGHAGKQRAFLLHFGLGEAMQVEELVVEWPDQGGTVQRFEDVKAGRYALTFGGELE